MSKAFTRENMAVQAEAARTTYGAFLAVVLGRGWTLAELRCDVRPSEEMLAAMDRFGLNRWEWYLTKAVSAGQVK